MKSKCCNSDVFIKEKSGQKCVYCKSCGKFIKNANKDDCCFESASGWNLKELLEDIEENLYEGYKEFS